MTATDLYELVKDLPSEALCGTIRYIVCNEPNGSSYWECTTTTDRDGYPTDITDDHAAALQRDAMTEYLIRWSHTSLMIVGLEGEYVFLRKGLKYETNAPTRLHALCDAVRYVAGQRSKE